MVGLNGISLHYFGNSNLQRNVNLYISHEIEQGRNMSHWIKEKSNQVCFGGSTAVMRSI